MAVTRSKRRTTGDVPHEVRTAPPRVVRRGPRLGSRESAAVIVVAMSFAMMLLLLWMMWHSLPDIEEPAREKPTTVASILPAADPSAEQVIELLEGIDHVQRPTAATPDHDPNKGLSKEDGYRAAVFFESDLVDEKYREDEDVLENGTEGGGCIEVYANEEDARKRDEYLARFDGGLISSGSHRVEGNCVIRISRRLDSVHQHELEEAIVKALEEEGR